MNGDTTIADVPNNRSENTLRSMLSEFYSRRMLSTAILVWVVVLLMSALAVFSAVQFFHSEETKQQIMYAALFLLAAQGIGLMKSFAWGMIHRCTMSRGINRLELRIGGLQEALKTRAS